MTDDQLFRAVWAQSTFYHVDCRENLVAFFQSVFPRTTEDLSSWVALHATARTRWEGMYQTMAAYVQRQMAPLRLKGHSEVEIRAIGFPNRRLKFSELDTWEMRIRNDHLLPLFPFQTPNKRGRPENDVFVKEDPLLVASVNRFHIKEQRFHNFMTLLRYCIGTSCARTINPRWETCFSWETSRVETAWGAFSLQRNSWMKEPNVAKAIVWDR